MIFVEVGIPENEAWILPIGDLHLGDKAFRTRGKALLECYMDWVKRTPTARVFLNGDIFNVASRISKTSPWESDSNEYVEASDLFMPIADRIIGATDGNHEARMMDMFGMSPTHHLCRELGTKYCNWSAVVNVKVGQTSSGRWNQNYLLYFHHTARSGSTVGGGLNAVAKLQDIVEGIDVYFGSHNHQVAAGAGSVWTPSPQTQEVIQRDIYFVDAGSYLSWNGTYGEAKGYKPTALGTPMIRLSGDPNKKHVEIVVNKKL